MLNQTDPFSNYSSLNAYISQDWITDSMTSDDRYLDPGLRLADNPSEPPATALLQ